MAIDTKDYIDLKNFESTHRKKSGFDVSLEGKQEFPPKVVKVRKINIEFPMSDEGEKVTIISK